MKRIISIYIYTSFPTLQSVFPSAITTLVFTAALGGRQSENYLPHFMVGKLRSSLTKAAFLSSRSWLVSALAKEPMTPAPFLCLRPPSNCCFFVFFLISLSQSL